MAESGSGWRDPMTPAELMRRVIDVTSAYKEADDRNEAASPREALATIMACIGDIAVTYRELEKRISRLEAERQDRGPEGT